MSSSALWPNLNRVCRPLHSPLRPQEEWRQAHSLWQVLEEPDGLYVRLPRSAVQDQASSAQDQMVSTWGGFDKQVDSVNCIKEDLPKVVEMV